MPRVTDRNKLIGALAQGAEQEIFYDSDSSDSSAYQEWAGRLNDGYKHEDSEGELDRNSWPGEIVMEPDEINTDVDYFSLHPATQNSWVKDQGKIGDLVVGFCLLVIFELLRTRYLSKRKRGAKDYSVVEKLLRVWKYKKPEKFRRWLRINPDTFDALVSDLSQYRGFHNNAHMKQTPIDVQVALALHRFGPFGNRGGVAFTADLYGATSRVLQASMCLKSIRDSVRWPTPEQQQVSKNMVAKLCKGNDEMAQGFF